MRKKPTRNLCETGTLWGVCRLVMTAFEDDLENNLTPNIQVEEIGQERMGTKRNCWGLCLGVSYLWRGGALVS